MKNRFRKEIVEAAHPDAFFRWRNLKIWIVIVSSFHRAVFEFIDMIMIRDARGSTRFTVDALQSPQDGSAIFRRRIASSTALVIVLSMLPLLWPAILNGYPLVFSDTGTYLTQAVEHHLGWDRPPFYSFAIMALHWRRSLWPVVAGQSILTVLVLYSTFRCFVPRLDIRWLPAMSLLLSVATGLPWFTSQIMPDVFTALLVPTLSMLVLVPERLRGWNREMLALAAMVMVVVHQTNLPLSVLLLLVLLGLRHVLAVQRRLSKRDAARLAAIPLAAMTALVGVNYAAHREVALSSGGDIFLLARLVDDGTARDVLQRECGWRDWQLCRQVDNLGTDTDAFLWAPHGPLAQIGVPELRTEAPGIIHEVFRTEPLTELRDMIANATRQFIDIGTGDGLRAWPGTVGPAVARDFPVAEYRRYRAARQARDALVVPPALNVVHLATFWLGLVATLVVMAVSLRRREPVAGLCLAALVCLGANAFITGALSGPHDRYQSRVAWLALFVPLVAAAALPGKGGVGRPTGTAGSGTTS